MCEQGEVCWDISVFRQVWGYPRFFGHFSRCDHEHKFLGFFYLQPLFWGDIKEEKGVSRRKEPQGAQIPEEGISLLLTPVVRRD